METNFLTLMSAFLDLISETQKRETLNFPHKTHNSIIQNYKKDYQENKKSIKMENPITFLLFSAGIEAVRILCFSLIVFTVDVDNAGLLHSMVFLVGILGNLLA